MDFGVRLAGYSFLGSKASALDLSAPVMLPFPTVARVQTARRKAY